MSLAFDPKKWWPAPVLPKGDGHDFALMFVVAALSFLAGLTAIAGVAADRASRDWRSQLTSSATVIVRPRGAETADEAAARAAEVLAGVPGVAEPRALSKQQADALLAPWIGPDALPADLPTPRLVALDLDPTHPADVADLKRALASAGLDADVDDHSLWTADILRDAAIARAVSIALFALITASLGAVIAFATRQGLAARRDVVDALHLVGATDAFVARLFQARFARAAAQAGLVGAVLAILAAIALKLLGAGQGLSAILPVDWRDLAVAAPFPLLGALVAAVTARITAMAALKTMP
ncbi:MAG: cell division protein FtsX [Caulobacterales bacterium]